MKEWTSCLLGEIATIQTGPFGTQLHSSDYVNIGIPVIMPTNIGSNLNILTTDIAKIRDNKLEDLFRYQVHKDDVIYSRRGDVEKCAFITNKQHGWLCGTGCLRVRFFDENSYPKYYAYQLSTDNIRGWISGHAVESTMPNLNSSILSRVPLVKPPLNKQRAIAAVLSSLDDKIDLLHRQNATLEAMAEALFRQWFVVEAKEEWEETTIDEAIIFYDSQRIPLSQNERDKKKSERLYPYYGAAQIMDYIDEYIFDGDYLLIAEDGTVRTELGFPILQRASGKFWVNNHAHIVQAKQPYTNDFVYIYLIKKNIDEIVTGAVQPKISQGNLKKLRFFKYPNNLVLEYNNRVKPYFDRVRSNYAQIRTLEKLRDTLLPKLMSGEVRVAIS